MSNDEGVLVSAVVQEIAEDARVALHAARARDTRDHQHRTTKAIPQCGASAVLQQQTNAHISARSLQVA